MTPVQSSFRAREPVNSHFGFPDDFVLRPVQSNAYPSCVLQAHGLVLTYLRGIRVAAGVNPASRAYRSENAPLENVSADPIRPPDRRAARGTDGAGGARICVLAAGVRDGVLPRAARHENGLQPLCTRHGDVRDVPQFAGDAGLWTGGADRTVSIESGFAIART